MSDITPVNGWQESLPFNVKMKQQVRNGHSRVQSFYHPSLEEVVHIVFNNRRKYKNKWYVVVTDINNERNRTEKLYRRLLPGAEDEVVTIWSGSSGRFIFEEKGRADGSVRDEAEAALLEYMKNNP